MSFSGFEDIVWMNAGSLAWNCWIGGKMILKVYVLAHRELTYNSLLLQFCSLKPGKYSDLHISSAFETEI